MKAIMRRDHGTRPTVCRGGPAKSGTSRGSGLVGSVRDNFVVVGRPWWNVITAPGVVNA